MTESLYYYPYTIDYCNLMHSIHTHTKPHSFSLFTNSGNKVRNM